MWMRQMTLDQIDLEGNGFHEALNAFIISHTMESPGRAEPSNIRLISSVCSTDCAAENLKVSQQCDCCCDPLLCFAAIPIARLFFFDMQTKSALDFRRRKATEYLQELMTILSVRNNAVNTAASITRIMKAALQCVSLRCRSQMNIHPAQRPRSHRGPARMQH